MAGACGYLCTFEDLHDERSTWLDLAHKKTDEAVFGAYGWDPGTSNEDLLEKLLALNLERGGVGRRETSPRTSSGMSEDP